jgi:hypothetical protein
MVPVDEFFKILRTTESVKERCSLEGGEGVALQRENIRDRYYL